MNGPLPQGDVAASYDKLGAELELSQAFSTPPPGMDKLVHQKITAATVVKSLSSGNFAAYEVLDRSGQLDKMEPSIIAQLRASHRAARAEARITLPLEFAREEADLVALSINPNTKPDDLIVATEKINAKYTQLTGDPARYRDAADLTRDMIRLDATYRQEQAELDRQRRTATSHADKEAIKLQEVTLTAERLSKGLSVDANAETQAIAWGVLAAKNPNAVNFHRVQAAAGGIVDRAHADNLRRTVSTAMGVVAPGDAASGIIKPEARPLMFHEAYAKMYLPLVQAAGDKEQEVALEYAGKYADELAKYHSFFVGRDASTVSEAEKIVAYQAAIRKEPKKADPKRVKAMADVLSNNEWFNADQVPSARPEELAQLLAPHSSPDVTPENAVSQAKKALPTLSVVGGQHWFRPSGATDIQAYWAQQVRDLPAGGDTTRVITGNEHNRAMQHAVTSLSEEAGITGVVVHQAPDYKGMPQFILKGESANGDAVLLGLPAAVITERWLKKQNRMTQQKFQEAEELASRKPSVKGGKFEPFGKPN
jgi:hypothetical protein